MSTLDMSTPLPLPFLGLASGILIGSSHSLPPHPKVLGLSVQSAAASPSKTFWKDPRGFEIVIVNGFRE
jgi:hypothetical protein